MTAQKKKTSALAGHDGSPLISNETLLALYDAMLRCRMLERRVRALRGTSRKATFGAGHEAAVAGALVSLKKSDAISPPPGALTPCLVKGVPTKTIFAWLGKKADDIPQRNAAHRVIAPGADLIAQLKSALRVAKLYRKARNRNIVVLFCDGAQIVRGDALELLRAAAADRLPILFVCCLRSAKKNIASMAHTHGLPGMPVDGHDVVAVYRVASEAIAHARRGNGPTLIECMPWAVNGTKKQATGDAIRNMEDYLSRKGLFSAEHRVKTMSQFVKELENAAAAQR
ncbi:MAG TPA: thiamine pyrophosphate-dependent enzyme [Terracidiphilus sp.]|nr:thiamine pyrophosphate-dependent enzyme [Terracidiphilus sp.]